MIKKHPASLQYLSKLVRETNKKAALGMLRNIKHFCISFIIAGLVLIMIIIYKELLSWLK